MDYDMAWQWFVAGVFLTVFFMSAGYMIWSTKIRDRKKRSGSGVDVPPPSTDPDIRPRPRPKPPGGRDKPLPPTE